MSRHQVLPYSTLAPWMKTLGAMTGFRQIARPYTLRYGKGKAFDKKRCDLSARFSLLILRDQERASNQATSVKLYGI
jgi:hypothetical protein